MRIGVAFSGGLTPSDVVECVKLADALGYESAWVAEGHGGDQFAILGACAAVTRRIRLGTSISSVFVRSATTIGMAAATVDQLANGRFILGLGGSHRVQVEPEHGIPFVQPTARLRDTIAIVRALVQDGLVSHRGEVITIERFDLWFRPLRPQIPIYVAALFPRMLEIAGQLADGVLLTWPTTGTIARADTRAHDGKGKSRAPVGVDALPTRLGCTREGDGVDELVRHLRRCRVAAPAVECLLYVAHGVAEARRRQQPVITRKEAGVEPDRGTQGIPSGGLRLRHRAGNERRHVDRRGGTARLTRADRDVLHSARDGPGRWPRQ